ncbi:MAG TPA: hypothetical protein VK886_07625 [Vicinamibacterales bacterium]|nr:hypothetical protein [Vicinamibacterales bacterium]
MRRDALAFVVLGAILAAAPVALAQPAEEEPARAPGWTLTPAVVVGWQWDSNVAMVPEGFNQEILADQVLLVTPSASLDFQGRHTTFGAGYSGAVRRYRAVGELDSYDQRFRAAFAHRPSVRLLVFARGGAARLPTTEDTELNGVPFRRTGSRVINGAGGVEARLTKFTTLRAAYELVDAEFDHERILPTFVLGGRSHGVTADLSRRFSERIAFGGVYEVRFARIRTQLGSEDPLTYQIMGGSTRFTLGPVSSLLIAGGLSTLTDPRFNDTSVGPFLRVSYGHHFERAILNAGYERSFVPTFGFAASSQTEQLNASLLMPVARNRAYVQASTAWRRNDPLLEEDPALKSLWIGATVGYAIARMVRVEGFYHNAWQDTPIAGGKVNRHRVGAQLVLSAPVRVP